MASLALCSTHATAALRYACAPRCRARAACGALRAGPARRLATVIDGRAIAGQIEAEVRLRAAALRESTGVVPGLAVVIVGDRADSVKYVHVKQRAARALGFHSEVVRLPAAAPQHLVMAEIARLNSDPRVHGLLVQLPLPTHMAEAAVVNSVSPAKDVDGFHYANAGRLARVGDETRKRSTPSTPFDGIAALRNVPATPLGCVELLRRTGIQISGARAVVLGRSNIVGLPLSLMLTHLNATVTVVHSATRNAQEICRQADILVSAVGRPNLIGPSAVKAGACVIDVGISYVKDDTAPSGYRLHGDVDFEAVRQVASHVTPVPGGVGPVTVAMLMSNTLLNAEAMGAAPLHVPGNCSLVAL